MVEDIVEVDVRAGRREVRAGLVLDARAGTPRAIERRIGCIKGILEGRVATRWDE